LPYRLSRGRFVKINVFSVMWIHLFGILSSVWYCCVTVIITAYNNLKSLEIEGLFCNTFHHKIITLKIKSISTKIPITTHKVQVKKALRKLSQVIHHCVLFGFKPNYSLLSENGFGDSTLEHEFFSILWVLFYFVKHWNQWDFNIKFYGYRLNFLDQT
jgi:hypothetical protein